MPGQRIYWCNSTTGCLSIGYSKHDSELVERSGTQRYHRASTNFIHKADSSQINHHHRLEDHTSSSRYRAGQAEGALHQPEPATILPMPKVFQASSIWSSPSISVLPSPGIGEPSKFTWCKPLQNTSTRDPQTAEPLSSGVGRILRRESLSHVCTTSLINSRPVRSSAASPFSHSDSLICLLNVLY